MLLLAGRSPHLKEWRQLGWRLRPIDFDAEFHRGPLKPNLGRLERA